MLFRRSAPYIGVYALHAAFMLLRLPYVKKCEELASGDRTFSFVSRSDTGGFTGFIMVLFLTRTFPAIVFRYFQMKDARLDGVSCVESFDSSRTENLMSHHVDGFPDYSEGKLGIFLPFPSDFSEFCQVQTKTLWLEVVFLHGWTLCVMCLLRLGHAMNLCTL